jgi:hypothetical protein
MANTRSSCCTTCGRLPQERARLIVVRPHREPVDDDLAAAGVRGDERRRPVEALGTRRAPELAAGGRVEHRQKPAVEVVEEQNQPPVVQRGGRALAERVVHPELDAEVLLPEARAVQ